MMIRKRKGEIQNLTQKKKKIGESTLSMLQKTKTQKRKGEREEKIR